MLPNGKQLANNAFVFGEFKNDELHGQGTFYYANGDKYVGEFKNDSITGQGIGINADGSIIHNGEWKNEVPVF